MPEQYTTVNGPEARFLAAMISGTDPEKLKNFVLIISTECKCGSGEIVAESVYDCPDALALKLLGLGVGQISTELLDMDFGDTPDEL